MTVTNQTTQVAYQGNNATTVFTYSFLIPSGTQVVSLVDTVAGTTTVLNPAAYLITGLDLPAGGSVTYPLSGSPLATTVYILIQRVVDYTQEFDFSNQDAFYPETVEEAFDAQEFQIQQLVQLFSQAVLYNAVDAGPFATLPPAATRANKYFTFDANGNPTVATNLNTGVVPVSPAMVPVLAASTVAAALALLGGLPGTAGSTSTGTANAQVIAATGFTLGTGVRVSFIPGFSNTAALTLNVNMTGVIATAKRTTGGLVPLIGTEITAGVTADFVYDGTVYVLMEGTESLSGTFTNIASASTTDLGTIASHDANVTGSVTILSFGSSAAITSPLYTISFNAALTIKHNPSLIFCPGGVDIVTANGDISEALYLGSGVWRIFNYQPTVVAIYNRTPAQQSYDSTFGQAFSKELLHVLDSAGAGGSRSAATGWNTLTLNTTLTNEITGASLASNQVTLPAGTYYFEGAYPSGIAGTTGSAYQARLRNITAGSTIRSSSQMINGNASNNSASSSIVSFRGRFTISVVTVIEIQSWLNSAGAIGGTQNSGETNIIAELLFWRVA